MAQLRSVGLVVVEAREKRIIHLEKGADVISLPGSNQGREGAGAAACRRTDDDLYSVPVARHYEPLEVEQKTLLRALVELLARPQQCVEDMSHRLPRGGLGRVDLHVRVERLVGREPSEAPHEPEPIAPQHLATKQ